MERQTTPRTRADLEELSEAEQQVLDEIDTGEVVVLGDGARPEGPDQLRQVRAALIRMLLLPREGDGLPRLHEKGLQIQGAWVPDALDLEGCRIGCDVALFQCSFAKKPALRSATLDGLYLNGSSLPGLNGDRLDVTGNVHLHSVVAQGEVRLLGAKVGGSLDCTGARFNAEKDANGAPGDAFSADRLDAQGGVFLTGVEARGEVRLLGAKLGGDLECTRARFNAEKDANGAPGDAFSADGLDAQGGVFLTEVEARGTERLLGAKLGGNLNCIGAKFKAEKDASGAAGYAFAADRLDAQGGVFLKGVKARGHVRLLGAKVGGGIFCEGASFGQPEDTNPPVAATHVLSFDGAHVTGGLFLRQGVSINGVLDMSGAEFGDIVDEPSAWPPPGALVLDRCRYGAFVGRGPVDVASRLDWLTRMDPKRWGQDFWPQPYEQLAKVLREMGHGEDARAVLVEKERRQRAARRARAGNQLFAGLLWLRDGLLGALVGYGRRPMRAFLWLALLWLVGAGVFWSAFKEGALRPTAGEALKPAGWTSCAAGPGVGACFLASADGRHYPPFEPLVYAAETLLPVVNLEQRAFWTPDPVPVGGRGWWTRGYLWAHTLTG